MNIKITLLSFYNKYIVNIFRIPIEITKHIKYAFIVQEYVIEECVIENCIADEIISDIII
ncbi:hypothetical protein MYSEV_128 [Mythimna separata entomopoxvirus 'L']|uniref:Uncharacterized protein n=1 Tax=Mythimna separata entomopoxvirus 'L' TaxID=1293572 RepID=A0A916KQ67_9POXV|nr:hypothetical protein MYSEV_128 [Mythimna separata entomopoxvirus 'L']CCU56326.1 hypothetical protein MYSEV_128 [Mythimna separata entomopoxvirus 'L']